MGGKSRGTPPEARPAAFDFSILPVPAYVLSAASLRFLAVNDAAVREYGYSRDEFLSLTLTDIRPSPDVSRELGVDRAPADPDAHGVWPHLRKDGSVRWTSIVAQRIRVGRRDARLVLAADPPVSVGAGREDDDLARKAAAVGHDLDNLLTAIAGLSELVARRSADEPMLRAEMAELGALVRRAGALTSLLQQWNKEAPSRRGALYDVRVLLGLSGGMLRHVAGEGIRLEISAPAPAWVSIDPTDLERILVNLVTNAREALAGRGKVLVSLARFDVGTRGLRDATGQVVPPAKYAALEVVDDGPGIAPATFERLFRDGGSPPGAPTRGLGLAIVRALTDAAGGYVLVDTASGKGTRIVVLLPAVAAPAF